MFALFEEIWNREKSQIARPQNIVLRPLRFSAFTSPSGVIIVIFLHLVLPVFSLHFLLYFALRLFCCFGGLFAFGQGESVNVKVVAHLNDDHDAVMNVGQSDVKRVEDQVEHLHSLQQEGRIGGARN